MPVSGWGWAARGTRQSGGMVPRGNAVTEPGKQQSQCRGDETPEGPVHQSHNTLRSGPHPEVQHNRTLGHYTFTPRGIIHSEPGVLQAQSRGHLILKFRQSTLRPQGTVHLGPKAMKTPTQRHCTLRPSIIALPKYRGAEFSFRNTNQIQMQHRQYPSPLLTHI